MIRRFLCFDERYTDGKRGDMAIDACHPFYFLYYEKTLKHSARNVLSEVHKRTTPGV